ncbi:hypothetical protein [Bdellovibrio bacteriovorus]|uniref:hypothetical protein n=1 Tax=Bdellovibrio bacteriovorus TaxID=959 RepID=UPI0035A8D26A
MGLEKLLSPNLLKEERQLETGPNLSIQRHESTVLGNDDGAFFFSSLAFADLGESLVLCKHNKTVRTLRVEMGEDQKCRAIYTKQGVDETIGSGLNPNSCVEFVSNVRKNLEEAKWNCREVKEARTSNVISGAE